MTKKEIVRQIAEDIHETQLKTKDIVQRTFEAIVQTLLAERRIELRNFGVFEVKLRKPRKARNPRTSKPVEVPAKFVVTFKPGKEMEEKVRDLIVRQEDLEKLKRKTEKARKAAAATAAPPASAPASTTTAPVPAPSPVSDGNGSTPADPDSSAKKKRPKKAPLA